MLIWGNSLTVAGCCFVTVSAPGRGHADPLMLASSSEGADAAYRRTALVRRHSRCLRRVALMRVAISSPTAARCADAAPTRRREGSNRELICCGCSQPLMAQSVTSLRRTSLVAIGGKADIGRSCCLLWSDANDPNRSYARSKSRSAAISCLLSCVLSFRSKAREALNGETARVQHAARRRGGGVAAGGAGAAGRARAVC